MRNKFAAVSDPNIFVSCAGSPVHITYSPVVSDSGSLTLCVSGSVNSDDIINSYADSCDMSIIISRLTAGDSTVLTSKRPMYGDFTDMPKSRGEALQMVIDAERKFNQLPLDVRNNFDNDYRKWFTSAGTDSWCRSMGFVRKDELTFENGSIEKASAAVSSDVT